MAEDILAVVEVRWSIGELQEVVSNAECAVIHGGGRADYMYPLFGIK